MIIDIGLYDWLEVFIFRVLQSGQDVYESTEDLAWVLGRGAVFSNEHWEESVEDVL